MKTIIVTGAGSGLGKELALLLAKKGYHILLTGRTAEKLAYVKSEIESMGGKADILTLDIRNQMEVKESLAKFNHQFTLYGLINNAGLGHFGPFLELTEPEIKEMFDTNVFGTFHMTKEFLPYVVEQNEGHILNIISTAGLRGKMNEAVYAASKFAVRGFTESLQKEYEETNIKFTAIYMGGMDTPFWANSSHIKDPSRLKSPREIAQIILDQMEQETITIES
jgi:short-subunit dehydrogenase